MQLPFEATTPPRRWMGAAAIATGLVYLCFVPVFQLTEPLASSHLALTLLDIAFRAGLLTLAAFTVCVAVVAGISEFARRTLRITTTRLEYLPPAWMNGWPLLSGAAAVAIDAGDVRRLAWDGYDNIGIELKSGQVLPVYFRSRLAKGLHAGSRLAVLAFVAHVSREPPPSPPLDVAPWVVGDPARARV